MKTSVAILRLQDAWRECERNVYHLCHALDLLYPILPMTGDKFEHLTDEQIQTLDQFILRFIKLQDALGGHMYSAILEYLQESYEERPMLDKLNRLEKLGYLQSAETWQDIRNIRNKFSHGYPDDGDKNAALINMAIEAATNMHGILAAIETKLRQNHPEINLGKPLLALPNATRPPSKYV